jgi:UDP-GalNAc:undecaprenyl-phosphate GalNAc-1-phosphate transferase
LINYSKWPQLTWFRIAGSALSLFFALSCAALASWGWPLEVPLVDVAPLVSGSVLAYLISGFVAQRVSMVDKDGGGAWILVANIVLVYGLFALLLLFSRVYYSRTFILIMLGATLVWLLGDRFLRRKAFRPVYGYIYNNKNEPLLNSASINWILLDQRKLPAQTIDALVVDPYGKSPQLERIIVECSLKNIPVLSESALAEALSGRVRLNHMAMNNFDNWSQNSAYAQIKRLAEKLLIVSVSPILLPLMLCIAIAIKLDSRGTVLFKQTRVGQDGREFLMLKFRSMHKVSHRSCASYAEVRDSRITRVGRFIRRVRMDELPQFWNVLRGEMSLIGPRPEQVEFARKFEQSIPFYAYRHLVRPGITGWAQVNQGYTACEESSREKLEYDLYYAKHLSVWLDLVIAFRTLRIIASGFGAR